MLSRAAGPNGGGGRPRYWARTEPWVRSRPLLVALVRRWCTYFPITRKIHGRSTIRGWRHMPQSIWRWDWSRVQERACTPGGGRGNTEAYWTGFRGERSAQSPAFSVAGTPNVPASQLSRLLPSVAAAVVTFGVAAHTGISALSHLRSSSKDKVKAYEAVILSNANTAYCYTREVANFVAYVFQLVSHDALVSWPGFAASIGEYGFNLSGQHRVRERNGIDHAGGFDLRWPAISAATEAVDVPPVLPSPTGP